MPLDTLSPTLTFSSFTTPAPGDGISIVALSDSSVMSDCSFVTASPGLTSTSMTSTSLKSPMSGNDNLAHTVVGSAFSGSMPYFLIASATVFALHIALLGERLQRRDGDEVAIHLEEVAQLGARIGAAEAVGAEHAVDAIARHERRGSGRRTS